MTHEDEAAKTGPFSVALWRSTDPVTPRLGYDTSWSTSEEHARWYMTPSSVGGKTSRQWGGNGLFRVKVDINPTALLDLRTSPWHKMLQLFGVDRDNFPGAEDYEVIGSRVPTFERRGYLWVVFLHAVDEDEWIYMGRTEVPATLVDTRRDDL
jgi:hypothetical protein